MNKSDLFELLRPYTEASSFTNEVEIKNLDWKSQNADVNTALFYWRSSGIKSDEQFQRLMGTCKYAVLITNRLNASVEKTNDYIVIKENNWSEVQKICCDQFYPIKANGPKLVGVTGTNGKTTTTNLAMQIAEQNNRKALCVGTLGVVDINGVIYDFSMTTPPYIELRKIISKYSDKSVIFFETSSHGLEQDRFYKIPFDFGAWTSFSRDHLDYHLTEENYFKAKLLLKDHLKGTGFIIVPWREIDLLEKLKNIEQITKSDDVSSFWNEKLPLFFSSEFNKSNLELAYMLNKSLWGSETKVDVNKLVPPAGRFNVIAKNEKISIIDFAHTPDAIENICKAIKKSYPDKKLWIVFGCGGDRDRGKRPQMGHASEKYCEKIFLTSDNPRSENPNVIIEDILEGIQDKSICYKDPDRKNSIQKALSLQDKNILILIAGKGHENYIEIKGVKHPYSDEQVVKEIYGV